MSEKQFECVFKEHETNNCWSMIKDNQLDRQLYIRDVVGLLNKQKSLINALKKENKELKEELKKAFDVPIPYVENSMRRLRAEHKVDEQQATIEQLERKLELKTEEVEYLKRMMVKWGMVKDE